jgi:hypothetical protein
LGDDLAAGLDLAAQRVAVEFSQLTARQGAADDAVPRLAGSASDGSAGLEKLTAGNIHVLIPFEILVWLARLARPAWTACPSAA